MPPSPCPPSPCPPPQRLHLFVAGKLGETDKTALVQHLAHCPACAKQLAAMQADAWQGAEPSDPSTRPPPRRLPIPTLSFLGPPQADGEIGRLGQYRVLRQLGSGGMGLVFDAEDTVLHRRVAVKVMHPELASVSSLRDRFIREARAMAQVRSDHVVTVYNAGEENGVAFLAMELLAGRSLEERLQAERVLPLAEALRIGREIAEGLAAAHACKLIHRDIKPANIWLEQHADGSPAAVKILDFGLAHVPDANKRLTQQGVVLGTPSYMAPEQALGKPVDPRCDLFSLGVVLYQMATGALPFGTAKSVLGVLTLEATDPRKHDPSLPPRFCELLLELMTKDPAGRPDSAKRVAVQLRGLESQLSSRKGKPTARHEMPALTASTAEAPKSRVGFYALVALAAVGALVLALAVVGGAVWFFLLRGD
jgi:serine/threonine protein kinase